MNSIFEINMPGDKGRLYEVIQFPAGEKQVRLTEAGRELMKDKVEYYITANPIPDIIELAQLADAMNSLQVFYSRILILPYMPFGRADRRFVVGDTWALKVFVNLVASLDFTDLITFDQHSPVAEHLFLKKKIGYYNMSPVGGPFDQLNAIILNDIGPQDLCLIRPDKGSIGRYSLEVEYNLPVLQGDKVRDPGTGKLSGFTIDPAIKDFKKALIVDDICDGGGTFIGLAQEIKKLNPDIELYLYVSHGIFSKGLSVFDGIFDRVYVSGFSYRFSDFDSWKVV